ncbi:nascent polypeptide-associated complex protein [Candidatus Woesearchaeota archaeon]|nr:nascent polypeptide-associated complex protein [Candidatus Woesearchaeota archaeon]
MIPGMNPRKMQQMMKQMGIQQKEIDAKQVIIKTSNKQLIFNNPQVSMINMMGQDTFQIIGEFEEKPLLSYNEDDIKTVMESTDCSKEEAQKALTKTNGDIAEAIVKIQDNK